MGKLLIILLGLIVSATGIVLVNDARKIAISRFNKSETNDAVKDLKIVGFIVLFLGLSIIYISK